MVKIKPMNVPSELQGSATISDVNYLDDKIEKCYSQERYEEFQDAVEKIIGRYLKSVVGWAVFVWLITIFASMLLQKFFNVFGA